MSKEFSSKSWDHVASYPLVKSVVSYSLSFKVFQVLTTYLTAVFNYAAGLLFSAVPASKDYLEFFDTKFDANVLTQVDFIVSKVEPYYTQVVDYASSSLKKLDNAVAENKKHSQEALESMKKNAEDVVSGYLKPVNEYASSSVDKVLPKSKKKADEAKTAADNEISKSIEIVSDTFERSKDLIQSKSSEISNAVVSTYNKEFEAAPEKNYYVKVASASMHTGVTLLKNVNNEIIQPLTSSTQTYVSETVNKAEKSVEETAAKAQEYVANGSAPIVSALA